MENYIEKTVLEIENYILNELHFKKIDDKYIYELKKEQVVGQIIINNQVQQQIEQINLKIFWDQYMVCYDMRDIDCSKEENYMGIGYTFISHENTSQEQSIIAFVKNVNDFKILFGLK